MTIKAYKMYELVKRWCSNTVDIPEKELIRLIGEEGIELLLENKFLSIHNTKSNKKSYSLN